MRILIAHSFYRVAGGEDRYVQQQLELLGDDHTVELLSARNEELAGNVSAAKRMVGSRGYSAEVKQRVAHFGPDLIHVHNVYPSLGPAVHLASRDLGIPLVMTVHNYRLRCPNGLMFTESQPCRRCLGGNTTNAVIHDCFPSRGQAAAYATALWVHRFVLHLERDVSAFIAPSEFMRETLISWGISADRTELIRNFTDAAREHSPQPRTYGLYLGRLTAEKGLDVMVRALVAAGDPEFKIAGDGPYEGELKQMVAGAGLSNTHFLGRVERGDIPGLFAGARFMALPSIWDENAPLAAMEAMAHGVPLLVSDKGGLPELAQGRGVVCPAGDVSAFAGGIDRLTAGESERLGREARLFAAEHLTAAKHRGELERAYRRAIEKQGAAGI